MGIEDFRFHDLRHSAVTNLRAAGVDVETIMKIAGHSSVEMFLRYRAVDEEELDAAMEKLEVRQTHPPTPIQHHNREREAISSQYRCVAIRWCRGTESNCRHQPFQDPR